MSEFAYRIADDPQGLKAEANARVDMALAYAEQLAQHGGLDGFALCSDYCFNTSPFLSPSISNPTPRASRSPSINPSTCSPNKSLHSA